MVKPLRDKNERSYRRGGRDDTCDHGLPDIAEGKTSYLLGIRLESESDVYKKNRIIWTKILEPFGRHIEF